MAPMLKIRKAMRFLAVLILLTGLGPAAFGSGSITSDDFVAAITNARTRAAVIHDYFLSPYGSAVRIGGGPKKGTRIFPFSLRAKSKKTGEDVLLTLSGPGNSKDDLRIEPLMEKNKDDSDAD